jgi:hypothetical protein
MTSRPIDSDSAHGAEASTDDRWIQAGRCWGRPLAESRGRSSGSSDGSSSSVIAGADCVEVAGSHVGLILNRKAYRAIAGALALPEIT